LSVIDYDYQGGVIITGTSSVPGRVRFSAQNAVIGETGIGVGGRWNFIAGRLLPRIRVINIRAELIPASGALNAPEDRISVTYSAGLGSSVSFLRERILFLDQRYSLLACPLMTVGIANITGVTINVRIVANPRPQATT